MHNPELAKRQGLDKTTTDVIDSLHILRDYIEVSARMSMTKEEVVSLYNQWFVNEQLLQKLWKFPEDTNYIRFWTFPKCNCPRMDNDDNYPYGSYVTRQDCLIHGWEE